MLPLTKLVPALTFLLVSATGQAADKPPRNVRINSISYGGTGCPGDTVTWSLSEDRSSFTLLFDDYTAETGPGVERAGSRKKCQINLELAVPPGWRYSVASFGYRGYAWLENNIRGRFAARYYFSGSTEEGEFSRQLVGPWDGEYRLHTELELKDQVWSPCDARRNLNISTSLNLFGNVEEGAGVMSTSELDGGFVQTYGLAFSTCP